MLSALGYLAVPCILCFLFGILMFIVEMFTPGFGVAGFLGIAAFAAIIVMQFLANSVTAALIVTAVLVLLLAIIIVLFIRSFQKGALSRSKIVNDTAVEGDSSPVIKEKGQSLVGKTGTAITALRPAGIAEIDGQRMNVSTYGNFIEPGKQIVVAAVEGLNVFVKTKERGAEKVVSILTLVMAIVFFIIAIVIEVASAAAAAETAETAAAIALL